MTHTFDTDIAKEYGVDIAILVNNIAFWLQKNKANKKHIYDGKVWTYNTTKAFSELFHYWTQNQIRRILDNMEKAGILEIGNYNATAYDRTKWYTFTDAFVKTHTSICENTQMDLAENPNGFGENHEPIPDNKPVDNQDSKHNSDSFDLFWEAYPNKKAKGNAEKAWLKLKVNQTLLDIILTAIEQHKQSKEWTADGGRYIPHPASWLNARRWEDEISKQAEPTKSVDIESFKEWEQL